RRGQPGGGGVGVVLRLLEGILRRHGGGPGRLCLHAVALELRLGGGDQRRDAADLGSGGVLLALGRGQLPVGRVGRIGQGGGCRCADAPHAEDRRGGQHDQPTAQ